jgi:hypothetical protein
MGEPEQRHEGSGCATTAFDRERATTDGISSAAIVTRCGRRRREALLTRVAIRKGAGISECHHRGGGDCDGIAPRLQPRVCENRLRVAPVCALVQASSGALLIGHGVAVECTVIVGGALVTREEGREHAVASCEWAVIGPAGCRGSERPRFVDATTQRMLDFVAAFVDPSSLASLRVTWADLERQRRLAYDLPWAHAVLRVLELDDYLKLPESTCAASSRSASASARHWRTNA